MAQKTSDIDTLFELAREGEAVNGELSSVSCKLFGEQLERLETGMLLSGENDSRGCDCHNSSGRGRNGKPGLGGDVAAHVPALG